MKMLPFSTERRTSIARTGEPVRKRWDVAARKERFEIEDASDGDFEKEIGFTRSSGPLMAFLRSRGSYPATVSLQGLKLAVTSEH
jgi:hypothetical protein